MRLVGDDPVDSSVQESVHLVSLVHRPDQHSLSVCVVLGQGASRSGPPGPGQHGRGSRVARCDPRCPPTDQRGTDRRQCGPKTSQLVLVAGLDDGLLAPARRKTSQHREQVVPDSGDRACVLHVHDHDRSAIEHDRKYVLQRGHAHVRVCSSQAETSQVREAAGLDSPPADVQVAGGRAQRRGVVHEDQAPVPGAAYVDLDAVTACVECCDSTGRRVLGKERR